MIKYLKKIWDDMDEQTKILAIYMLFLTLLVIISTN